MCVHLCAFILNVYCVRCALGLYRNQVPVAVCVHIQSVCVCVRVCLSVCLCISYVQFMLVLVVQCVHKVCAAIRCPGQHPMEGLVGFAITQLQLPHAQPSVSSVHWRVNYDHHHL